MRPLPQIPMLGQRENQARAAIAQAVGQISVGIYSQLAGQHIASRDDHQPVEPDRLRQLARDSQAAAQAYFEGLGLAQFQQPTPPPADSNGTLRQL